MTEIQLYAESRALRLGRRIGKGGEGEVYLLENEPNTALKIYTLTVSEKLASRENKVRAMIAANLSATSRMVSFPRAVVSDSRGRFKGFLMSAVRDHKVFHDLYGPASRKHSFPRADYKFLIRVATNISRAVASIHGAGCVVGDINHSGILVSDSATVSLIDADSFQFEWKSTTFPCEVGVPEYTPPELQGKSFGTLLRSKNHDRFGLAVLIFQLMMMGRHPFSGIPRRGEMIPLHEAIKQRRYVYSDLVDVGFDQPPGTPAVSDLSPSIAAMFDRAFTTATGNDRPSAEDWIKELEKFESELHKCTNNPMHFAPAPGDECPWCEMEALANVILFIPPIILGGVVVAAGAATSDLRAIFSQLQGLSLPPRDRILPDMAIYSPSINSVGVSNPVASYGPVVKKSLVLIGCILLFLNFPALWFFWGFGGYWLFNSISEDSDQNKNLVNEARNAGAAWVQALCAWQKKIGVDSFLTKKFEAEGWRIELEKISTSRQAEINYANSNRKASQLSVFLDGFEIRKAKIKGIGPARLAQLVSFGIETAADIERARLLSVPGFGDAVSRSLLDWRLSLEKRFVFNPVSSSADTLEISRINEKYRVKATGLERSIRSAVMDLSRLHQQILNEITRGDTDVEKTFRNLEVKRAELRSRGVSVPAISFDWPAAGAHGQGRGSPAGPGSAPSTTTTRAGRTSTSTPSCPRCGSSMQRRTARRGRNAGGSFWGCSRFPTCRGTRN